MIDEILRWLGMGLCHQLPERSFFGGGFQVPVCARDTGIYVGFAVALLLLAWFGRRRRPTEMPPLPITAVLVAGLALMVADGLTSYLGVRQTTNELRLVTGLASGFALAGFTLPLLNSQLWRNSTATKALSRPTEAFVFFLALPLLWLAVWWLGPVLGLGYPLLVAAAILFTFTAVNLVIVSLLPSFERKADRLRDSWPAIVIALALTVVELGLSSMLRVFLSALAGAGA